MLTHDQWKRLSTLLQEVEALEQAPAGQGVHIERLLIELLPFREQRLYGIVDPKLLDAPLQYISVADFDGDRQLEMLAVTRDRALHLFPDLLAATEALTNDRFCGQRDVAILGLECLRHPRWGHTEVELVANEAGHTWVADIQITRAGEIKIGEGGSKKRPQRTALTKLGEAALSPYQAEAVYAGEHYQLIQTEFSEAQMGTVLVLPHRCHRVVRHEEILFLAGSRTQLMRVDYRPNSTPTFLPNDAWQATVNGYPTDLEYIPHLDLLLVSCDDSCLYGFSGESGEQRWRVKCESIPLALTHWQDDGVTNLVVGFADGMIALLSQIEDRLLPKNLMQRLLALLPSGGYVARWAASEHVALHRLAAEWVLAHVAEAEEQQILPRLFERNVQAGNAFVQQLYASGATMAQKYTANRLVERCYAHLFPSIRRQFRHAQLLDGVPQHPLVQNDSGLVGEWIDVQHGVRRLWSRDFGGRIETMHKYRTGKSHWLLLGLTDGRFFLLDVEKQVVVREWPARRWGPLRGVISAETISDKKPDLWLLWADGTLHRCRPTETDPLPLQSAETIALKCESWTIRAACSQAGPYQIAIGSDRGCLIPHPKEIRETSPQNHVHHLALLKENNKTKYILSAAWLETGFTLQSVEEPVNPIYIHLPKPLAQLLAWHDKKGNCFPVAICTDGETYVYRVTGELDWQVSPSATYMLASVEACAPTGNFLDINKDRKIDLAVATSGQVIVYDQNSSRLAELNLEVSTMHLRTVELSENQRRVISATPTGTVHISKLYKSAHKGRVTEENALARAMERRTPTNQTPLELWRSYTESGANADVVNWGLFQLGELARQGRVPAEQIAVILNKIGVDVATPWSHKITLARSCIKTLLRLPLGETRTALFETIERMLHSEDSDEFYLALILAMRDEDQHQQIFNREKLQSDWVKLLTTIAGRPSATLRRGLACIITRLLTKDATEPVDPRWWSILGTLTGGEQEAANLAISAIALCLRNRYRSDQSRGWRMMHVFLNRGVTTEVLKALADTTPPILVIREAEQALFNALHVFVTTKDEKVPQLSLVAESLKRLGLDKKKNHLVDVYIHLARLAEIQTPEDMERFFTANDWSADFAAYLDDSLHEDEILGAFAKYIKQTLTRLQREIAKTRGESAETQIAHLRDLTTELIKLGEDIKEVAFKQRTHHNNTICAAALETLHDMLARWSRNDGTLGRWMHAIAHRFEWDIALIHATLQRDQFSVEFQLKNVGLVPGHYVQLQPPHLYVADHELVCELMPSSGQIEDRIEPDTMIRRTLVARLGDNHLDFEGQEATIRFFVVSTEEGRTVRNVERRINIPIAYRTVDYAAQFPTSWRVYSAELEQWLNSQSTPFLFFELDATAQDSFFNAALPLFENSEYRIVDFRRVYERVQEQNTIGDRRLQVTVEVLHFEIVNVLLGKQKEQLVHGSAYRSYFEEALSSGNRRVKLLCFSGVGFVVRRLLREERDIETLVDLFTYWQKVAERKGVRFILGASYLTDLILREVVPSFMESVSWIRPNYLAIETAQGRQEALTFLQERIAVRNLTPALTLFSEPVTAKQLLALCGGNLLFLHYFALNALERALTDRQDPEKKARFQRQTITTYLVEYGERYSFFGSAWIWLPIYEKILLTLIANADFELTDKQALRSVEGFTLSAEYRPGTPSGRRSSKIEAVAGEPLTILIADKIRRDNYFERTTVRLYGLAPANKQFLQGNHAANMLYQLLRATAWDQLLAQLTAIDLLNRASSLPGIGTIYTFKIPLWREFFVHHKLLQSMEAAARGNRISGGWYPPHLHKRQFAGGRPLFAAKQEIQPVFRELPVADVPTIDRSLNQSQFRNEYSAWQRFYGAGGRNKERWERFIALSIRLQEFAKKGTVVSSALSTALFAEFNKLFDTKAARELPGLTEVLGWKRIGEQGIVWQFTDIGDRILPGIRANMMIGFIQNSTPWSRAEITDLCELAGAHLQRAYEEEAKLLSHSDDEEEGQFERGLAVIFALQGAAHLRAQIKSLLTPPGVHYIVLDGNDLGDIVSQDKHSLHFLRLCQAQVGRRVLSPYRMQGPLSPGSALFVGRVHELEEITQRIEQVPFTILGSRRIGKTSLMQQVLGKLRASNRYVPLWIGIANDVRDFLNRLRTALIGAGFSSEADLLRERESHTAIRLALTRIHRNSGRFPVLLIDEIDNLYRIDKEKGEATFTVLRDIVQAQPRVCGLVMTGYRRIYFERFKHDSVFFNFGQVQFLGEVDVAELVRLIDMMKHYGAEFYHPDEARDLILDGTYRIPYLVQLVCHQLLDRLDRYTDRVESNRIEREDIETVLQNQIEPKLMEELVLKINVDADDQSHSAVLQLKLQILLYVTVLGKYGHTQETQLSYRSLADADRTFSPADVVRYLDAWAHQVRPTWEYTRAEVESLLQQLRMTLAISTRSPLDREEYFFTQEIVPRLLHSYFKKPDHGSLIHQLADTIALLVEESDREK